MAGTNIIRYYYVIFYDDALDNNKRPQSGKATKTYAGIVKNRVVEAIKYAELKA